MNLTLEYSDVLTATFMCTAFGGSGVEIFFVWTTTDLHTRFTSGDTLNANDSVTSTAIMTTHFLENREYDYTCCVSYVSAQENCETATITIGKKSIINIAAYQSL